MDNDNLNFELQVEPTATAEQQSVSVAASPAGEAPPDPLSTLIAPAANIAIPHIVRGATPLQIAWCWVPGGEFTMGSEAYSDEKPAHKVAVDGFWLARAPVTNTQFRLFMAAGGYHQARWWPEAGWEQRQQEKWTEPRFWAYSKWKGGVPQPVVGVSWYEAAAFCAWAAEATGEAIRLPSEAEWEKGARGVDGRRFPWGEAEPDGQRGNFNDMEGKITPVGQYSPQGDSPYGCTDMAGNVWEWCASKLFDYPYRADDGRNDRRGTDLRVARGGGWYYDSDLVRCANRGRFAPHYRYINLGFRCASAAF